MKPQILNGYPNRSDAPTFSQVEAEAMRGGKTAVEIEAFIDRFFAEEETKEYAFKDTEGNIWLSQNPALQTYQVFRRKNPVIQAQKRLVGTTKIAGNTQIRRGSVSI